LPCAGSYRKRCPHHGRKHLACMEELSIERVWQALAQLVRKSLPDSNDPEIAASAPDRWIPPLSRQAG
jgi:hypothetical protein